LLWVHEEILLDDYVGNSYIWIRFEFKSDTYVVGDGWVFDNVQVIVLAEPSYMLGDVNGDGVVNILDIVQIINHIMGLMELTPSQHEAADVNVDNAINILDIVQIANDILN